MRGITSTNAAVLPDRMVSKLRPRPAFLFLPIPTLFAALLVSGSLAAQPSAAARKAPPPHRPLPVRRQAVPPRPAAVPAAAPVKLVPVAAPQTPQWPVNGPPDPPTVAWDGHTLRIDAMNSSLDRILKDVSAQTGAKLQGFDPDQSGADQRIFGTYGPAAPREVLLQLLEGTGYNVILVGDRNAGEPLRIVLSVQPKGLPPGAQNNPPPQENQDDDAEQPLYQPPQPYPPQPYARPGLNPNQPPRTPQQIYQEMQQREQQIREEQMQRENQPQ